MLLKLPKNLQAKITKCDVRGCMEWQGERNQKGYGRLWFGGHRYTAHRFVFELYKGPLKEGHEIDHLCLNRCCVNPDHLEQVKQKVNKKRIFNRRKKIDDSGQLVGGVMKSVLKES